MKIDELLINGFGKFEHKSIQFETGLNVVYGANESGKSTLQMFINGMLYGLDKSQQRKYMPWGQKGFGVLNTLTYTLDNGTTYIVEKNFNRKTTAVFTSEPYQDVAPLFPVVSKNVLFMEEQTGLNHKAFESSVFMKQMEVRINQKYCSDVTERLLRLSQYGDENIDYNNAVKNLDNISSEIGKGNTGKYKKLVQLNRLIEELEQNKTKSYENIHRVHALQQNLKELNEQKQNLQQQVKELMVVKQYRKQPLMHRYQELNEQLDQCRQKQKSLEQQLHLYQRFANVTHSDIEEVDRNFSDYQSYRQKELELQIDIEKQKKQYIQYGTENGQDHFEQKDMRRQLLEDNIAQWQNALRMTKIFGGITMIIVFFLALIFGTNNPVWYALLITEPVIIGMFIYYHRSIKDKIATMEIKRQQLLRLTKQNQEVVAMDSIVQKLESEYTDAIHAKEQYYLAICQKLQELGIGSTEHHTLPAAIHELKQVFGTKTELQRKLDAINKEINMLTDSVEVASHTIDVNVGQNMEGEIAEDVETIMNRYCINESSTVQQVEQILEETHQDIKNIEIKISAVEKELELLSAQYIHPGDIEEQLETAVKEKKEYEDVKDAVDIAKSFLEQSLEYIQRSYLPFLNENTNRILSEITAGKYTKVDTSSSLDIVVRDIQNGTIQPEQLSNGTIDQLYFSLRLAAAQLLSTKETLPLIIDESFAQYDDERLVNTLKFLIILSRERQIILYTCHKRELDALQSLQGAYNVIRL